MKGRINHRWTRINTDFEQKQTKERKILDRMNRMGRGLNRKHAKYANGNGTEIEQRPTGRTKGWKHPPSPRPSPQEREKRFQRWLHGIGPAGRHNGTRKTGRGTDPERWEWGYYVGLARWEPALTEVNRVKPG